MKQQSVVKYAMLCALLASASITMPITRNQLLGCGLVVVAGYMAYKNGYFTGAQKEVAKLENDALQVAGQAKAQAQKLGKEAEQLVATVEKDLGTPCPDSKSRL